MKILSFFLFLGVIFTLLDPDPDPAAQINADPCGSGYGYGSASETLTNTRGTGGKICRWCCWYRWQICHRCSWHQWKICHRCCLYWWCTFTCEYLREFSKKFEMTLILFFGSLGHDSWKNLKQKTSWHCPFYLLWTRSPMPIVGIVSENLSYILCTTAVCIMPEYIFNLFFVPSVRIYFTRFCMWAEQWAYKFPL